MLIERNARISALRDGDRFQLFMCGCVYEICTPSTRVEQAGRRCRIITGCDGPCFQLEYINMTHDHVVRPVDTLASALEERFS